MINTVSMGDIGEQYAALMFSKKGCTVSKPLTNNARYDLVVEIQGKLYRVQVKSTECAKDGKMVFATKTTNYTKGSWTSNRYSLNEVDMFFLYCQENDWCGLYIPEDEIGTQLTIRTELPKNNQRTGIRLAEDYCFEKQLGELTQLAE